MPMVDLPRSSSSWNISKPEPWDDEQIYVAQPAYPLNSRSPHRRLAASRSLPSLVTTEVSHRSSFGVFGDSSTSRRSRSGSYRSSKSQQVPWSDRSTVVPRKLGPRARDLDYGFQGIPDEIYAAILEQLEVVHRDADPQVPSCSTCLMRDLCSLCLTNQAWFKIAKVRLYGRIHIVGHDSPAQLKKFKLKSGTRLKLLRKTLRERPQLAALVQELKVPSLQILSHGKNIGEAVNLVASLVMACPNLERLLGFHTTYTHDFDKLTHALSTRKKLRQHVWVIGKNATPKVKLRCQIPPDTMPPEQTAAFIHFHDSWSHLHTLFLYSKGGVGVIDHELFVSVFIRLPSLCNVCVSGFDSADFTDMTLQALPELQSLRLENLKGVTDQGLCQFAKGTGSRSIEHLSLIGLEISFLATVSKLFTCLLKLKRFTFLQESSPKIFIDALMQPALQSQSLTFLHWDILFPGEATEQLASSITAGGFPSLQTLRAPSDHFGVLQSVCKPRDQIIKQSDTYMSYYLTAKYERPRGLLALATPTVKGRTSTFPGAECAPPAPTTPTSPMLFPPDASHFSRLLPHARRNAQNRIEQARLTTGMTVTVTDYSRATWKSDPKELRSKSVNFPSFMGDIRSNVAYSLDPDIEGSDNAIVGFDDVLDTAGVEVQVKKGCIGLWNTGCPGGKNWYLHTERQRWQRIDLDLFS